MKEPTATLPILLARFQHADHRARHRGAAAASPIGAGPFVLKAQERGVSIDFEAFDKFYKPGLPKLKTIRIVAYADENLRVAALQAGDVDLIEYVPWQSMDAIESDPKLKLAHHRRAVHVPDLQWPDRTVRRCARPAGGRPSRSGATRSSRRRSSAAERRSKGLPLTPGTPFFDRGAAHGWRYDPERAKTLLAEAGVPNGFTCTLLSTAQYGMHKDTAEVVQQHLAEIGIQAELKLPDWATRVTLGNRGQYEIAVMGSSARANDPDGIAFLLEPN